jgi:hypothetical protein
MKTICAYCAAVIVAGPPAPLSHGICPACLETALAEIDTYAATVLEFATYVAGVSDPRD